MRNSNILNMCLWFFHFYCHFDPKIKSVDICIIKSCYFVFFLKGKMVSII
ncbi:hypothetical protein Hanom_Chr04g00319861 [Helianthus anomalus]